jgi:hypothetical protein
MDNNLYLAWRLEHQIRPAKIEQLLNTITTTDRKDVFPGSHWLNRLLAKAGKWMSLCRHSPAPTAAMLRRPSH